MVKNSPNRTSSRRPEYRYEGPEIIYTFWAKHGPCAAQGCGHRTPLLSTPVVAIKTLTVKYWNGYTCLGCGKTFDVERIPSWERKPEEIFQADYLEDSSDGQLDFFRETVEPIFERELRHRGIVSEGISYQADLVGWVEVG